MEKPTGIEVPARVTFWSNGAISIELSGEAWKRAGFDPYQDWEPASSKVTEFRRRGKIR